MSESLSFEDFAKLIKVDAERLDGMLPKRFRNKDGTIDPIKACQRIWEYWENKFTYIESKELGHIMELSKSRMSALATEGKFEQDGVGRLVRFDALRAAFRLYKERNGEGKSKLGSAKQEGRELENRLLRIKVEREESRSISIESATRAWNHIVLLAREKFLHLGNKIAAQVVFCKSETEAENVIQREIDECLSELAKPIEYVDEELKLND